MPPTSHAPPILLPVCTLPEKFVTLRTLESVQPSMFHFILVWFMAKQRGALRLVGRLANVVGYKTYDGKGDAYLAAREHVTEVANPQTLAQMSQRMKLTPIQNFYRGLQGLLDHSWQGVKYGNPSRLHFYSQTMRALSSAGVPFIPKGERQFVPWQFPLSTGSISASIAVELDAAASLDYFKTSLHANPIPTTIADFSNLLLTQVGFREGMQVTLVFVFNGSGFPRYYTRFVIDTSNTADCTEYGFACTAVSGTQVGVRPWNTTSDEAYGVGVAAAGVIVSELVGATWQRNNSSLVVADSVKQPYTTNAAFEEMLASYRDKKNTSSDWYLNQGGSADESASGGTRLYSETFELPGDVTLTNVAIVKRNGLKYTPYETDGSNIQLGRVTDESTITINNAVNYPIGNGTVNGALSDLRGNGIYAVTSGEFRSMFPDVTVLYENRP